MEIFFLDVGQASCSIILLGGKRAIVIDAGAGKGSLPLRFLKRFGIETIAALVITHSHADVAVISAATSSKHHPRLEVVQALTRNSATVMCSQISSRCTKNLEDARRNAIPMLHVSQSSTVPKFKSLPAKKPKSVKVPCAGTVRVELVDGLLNIDSAIEHRQFVQSLPSSPTCPMCCTQPLQTTDRVQGAAKQ